MPVDLTGVLDRLVRRVESQQFPRAAEAMARELETAARSALGGDLTLSGGGGTVVIDSEASRGRLVVTGGGAYKLADEGRHSVVPAKAAPGRALATPWGPRRSVRGSTSHGAQFTQRGASNAFRAGSKGVAAEVHWGR